MSDDWRYHTAKPAQPTVVTATATPAATLTLTDFLLARIAEDEADAREAVIPAHDVPNAYKPHPALARWRYTGKGDVEYDYDDPTPYPDTHNVTQGEYYPGVREECAPHIARHDPARVLAECEAKRGIVERCELVIQAFEDGVMWSNVNRRERSHARMTIRTLARVYADHPDYQAEWRA